MDKALSPLYTLAAFVKSSEDLMQLSNIAMSFDIISSNFRNVTGIPPSILQQYNSIVKNIYQTVDAGSYRISSTIINLQLAPRGIVSLIYPPDPKAIGHDLLRDSNRRPDALKAISEGFVMSGPVQLVQGGNMMIGRLPIFVDSTVPGAIDPVQLQVTAASPDMYWWGFATCLFNYEDVLEKSGIFDELAREGLVFNLTRLDVVANGNSQIYSTNVIASSVNQTMSNDFVVVPLQVPGNTWNLTLGDKNGFHPSWVSGAIAATVILSFCLAMFMLTILVSRKMQKQLLYRIMPARAIKRLQHGRQVVEVFSTVTIFFSDIVGFTNMANDMHPLEVMAMLNELYCKFDALVAKHGVYKVETIGDAYMVVGGAPDRRTGPDAAERVVRFALEAIDLVKNNTGDLKLQIRAGIASGPVVAGVVGTSMPRYCFFGDTVNTASRMESTSKALSLQISEVTYRLLRECKTEFVIVPRMTDSEHKLVVKGKGAMQTYWVKGIQGGAGELIGAAGEHHVNSGL
eukprot:768416-Hanusia_phi.AAC.1